MSNEERKARRSFNTAGTCFPELHYMVDVTERLERIRGLIGRGEYFCINRGRQYGKTTTLRALEHFLRDEYVVFRISVEALDDAAFASSGTLMRAFAGKLLNRLEMGLVPDPEGRMQEIARRTIESPMPEEMASDKCRAMISKLVVAAGKPVVVIVDEVDRAGNFDSFIRFLALLRDMYLDREDVPTFKSVILAGVYDVKNLKLKMRSEDDHQYNSPWNIAAPFDEDMSLSELGIAGMLAEYENDHHTGMDIAAIAKWIREYTSGYPFLVSRLCMLMDQSGDWSKAGFLAAERSLLHESNTLFGELVDMLDRSAKMVELFRAILRKREEIANNCANREIAEATCFCYVKKENGALRMHNRIFETFLNNCFYNAG